MDHTTDLINTVQSPALPHDLSPWGMFVTADLVVQAVMKGLLAASLLVWIVCPAKSWQLAAARRHVVRALATLKSTDSLAAALDRVTEADHETVIYVKADKTVAYGDLMDLMNGLRDAGYLKVALVGRQVLSE